MKKKNRYIAVAVLCVVLAAAFCGTAFAAFGAPAPREGSYYGLVNKSVTVPQYEEGVTVTSPSGKAVSLLSGGRFIATEEGIYTVRYSDGSAASVRVFATAPDVEFAFSYELAGDYGIGKRIVLPSAAIGSEGSGWSIG